jgi:hypothetical protein
MRSEEGSSPRTRPTDVEDVMHDFPSSPVPEALLSNSIPPLSSTQSPTVSSSKRNLRRIDNFLKGKSCLAYMLDPELEQSFSSSDTSLLTEEAVLRF